MAEKKENFFKRFSTRSGKFFRDTKSEIKKIVWPTRDTVFRNSGVVIATIIIIGLFVFGLDTLLANLLRLVMNIA